MTLAQPTVERIQCPFPTAIGTLVLVVSDARGARQ